MGRPKQHDERTAATLLETAERIVEADGLDALSVRRVAEEAGTTTRAVYSVFGSKDALVVALGSRAFELLGSSLRALPATDDPAADLVEAGVAVFRRFAVDHPSLFGIGVQWNWTLTPGLASGFRATAVDALGDLRARVARLEAAGLLGGRPVPEATTAFHAQCEGLAALELRGMLPRGEEERIWRASLGAVVTGLASAAPTG